MLTYETRLDDGETITTPSRPAWLGEFIHRVAAHGWTYTQESREMTIKIIPNDKGNPPGKLADAELHFTEGPLEGLKLIGFGIWQRRGAAGPDGRNVTFPARQYNVNGDRRSFSLLRPIMDTSAQGKLRELILEAYAAWEAEIDAAANPPAPATQSATSDFDAAEPMPPAPDPIAPAHDPTRTGPEEAHRKAEETADAVFDF